MIGSSLGVPEPKATSVASVAANTATTSEVQSVTASTDGERSASKPNTPPNLTVRPPSASAAIPRLPSSSIYSRSLGSALGGSTEDSIAGSLPVATPISRPMSASKRQQSSPTSHTYTRVHYLQLLMQRTGDDGSITADGSSASEKALAEIFAKDAAVAEELAETYMGSAATPIAEAVRQLFYPQEDSDTVIAIKQLSAATSNGLASSDRLLMLLVLAAAAALGAGAYPRTNPADSTTTVSREVITETFHKAMRALETSDSEGSAVAPIVSLIRVYPMLAKYVHGEVHSPGSSAQQDDAIRDAIHSALDQKVFDIEHQLQLFFSETGHSRPKRRTKPATFKFALGSSSSSSSSSSWKSDKAETEEAQTNPEKDLASLDERLGEVAEDLEFLRESVVKLLSEDENDQKQLTEQLAASLAAARKELEQLRRNQSAPVASTEHKFSPTEVSLTSVQKEPQSAELQAKIAELEQKLREERESAAAAVRAFQDEQSRRVAAEAKIEDLTQALREEKAKLVDFTSKQLDTSLRIERRHELAMNQLQDQLNQAELSIATLKAQNAQLQYQLAQLQSESSNAISTTTNLSSAATPTTSSASSQLEGLLVSEQKSGKIPPELATQLTRLHTQLLEQESQMEELKHRTAAMEQLEARLALAEKLAKEAEEAAATDRKMQDDALSELRTKVEEVATSFHSLLPRSRKLDHVAPSAIEAMSQSIRDAFAAENKLMRDAFMRRIARLQAEKQLVVNEFAQQMRKRR